jgi:hypothetical protein
MKKHWMEKRKALLIGLAAYIAIVTAFYIFAMNDDEFKQISRDYQMGIYFWSLFLGGMIYAGLMFNDYSRKETGIFNLLLPASHLEKALVYICFGVIFYWIAFAASFILVEFICFQFLDEDPERTFALVQTERDVDIFFYNYLFFLVQTLFVLGSIYFRRFAFFKTTIVIVIIFVVALPYLIGYVKVGDHDYMYNLINITGAWSYDTPGQDPGFVTEHVIAELPQLIIYLIYFIGLLIWIGFSSVIYFRLKEKQI